LVRGKGKEGAEKNRLTKKRVQSVSAEWGCSTASRKKWDFTSKREKRDQEH